MHTLAGRLIVTAGIIACGVVTVSAQWRDVVTKGVPMTPSGTPNYEAPAPKRADGKTPERPASDVLMRYSVYPLD